MLDQVQTTPVVDADLEHCQFLAAKTRQVPVIDVEVVNPFVDGCTGSVGEELRVQRVVGQEHAARTGIERSPIALIDQVTVCPGHCKSVSQGLGALRRGPSRGEDPLQVREGFAVNDK